MTNNEPHTTPSATTTHEPPAQHYSPGSAQSGHQPSASSTRTGNGTLRRTNSRILGGVSGAIADVANVDVNLVRLGWVLLTVFAGFGPLLYLAGWALIPDQRGEVIAMRLSQRARDSYNQRQKTQQG